MHFLSRKTYKLSVITSINIKQFQPNRTKNERSFNADTLLVKPLKLCLNKTHERYRVTCVYVHKIRNVIKLPVLSILFFLFFLFQHTY